MLPPEFLESLPSGIVALMEELEDFVLGDICMRIEKNSALSGTAENQIRVLQAQGLDMTEIKKKIQEISGLSDKEIDRIFDAAIAEAQSFNNKIFTLADMFPQPDAVALLSLEAAAIKAQIKDEVFNLTQSLGFAVRKGGKIVYMPVAEAYHNAMNAAVYALRSGSESYNQAIKKAVKELASSGVRTVVYDSGHTDSIDVAVRRAVMTGVNQISAKYSEFSADFLETDLVEVSAHIGARDKPGPLGWEAHVDWQGKVYRWKEKPRTSTGDYPDFEESTGYGDVQGLCGANCRHNFFAFIEGVSERTYTDEQLKELDPPPFVYQGREYTAYEATQMQRKLERAIRKQKNLMTAYDTDSLAEEYQAAKIKHDRLMKEYKTFSKAAGLPPQPERLKQLYKP